MVSSADESPQHVDFERLQNENATMTDLFGMSGLDDEHPNNDDDELALNFNHHVGQPSPQVSTQPRYVQPRSALQQASHQPFFDPLAVSPFDPVLSPQSSRSGFPPGRKRRRLFAPSPECWSPAKEDSELLSISQPQAPLFTSLFTDSVFDPKSETQDNFHPHDFLSKAHFLDIKSLVPTTDEFNNGDDVERADCCFSPTSMMPVTTSEEGYEKFGHDNLQWGNENSDRFLQSSNPFNSTPATTCYYQNDNNAAWLGNNQNDSQLYTYEDPLLNQSSSHYYCDVGHSPELPDSESPTDENGESLTSRNTNQWSKKCSELHTQKLPSQLQQASTARSPPNTSPGISKFIFKEFYPQPSEPQKTKTPGIDRSSETTMETRIQKLVDRQRWNRRFSDTAGGLEHDANQRGE